MLSLMENLEKSPLFESLEISKNCFNIKGNGKLPLLKAAKFFLHNKCMFTVFSLSTLREKCICKYQEK